MVEIAKPRKLYSLRKARHIMQTTYDWYRKKSGSLDKRTLHALENDLQELDQALMQGDRQKADLYARKLQEFGALHIKKSPLEYAWELLLALIFALIVAIVVRQMWFEFYEIPTGSMRPTFKEQDHLTVSKLAFGINIPLKTSHFYFDPDLVQRGGVVIFSGDKIPFMDAETNYFWVLPYKKRYIKRLIGKPGDSLYFYGGKVYGVDQSGQLIHELLDVPWMQSLEHVPFLHFEGYISSPKSREVLFKQMNQPIGKLSFTTTGAMVGEVFNGKEWVKDRPSAQDHAHSQIETYSDFWGMRNYAMARLLTKQELQKVTDIDIQGIPEGILYLELRHTPSLTYPQPRFQQDSYGTSLQLVPHTTIIPLQQKHLDALMDNMYTARFVVSDGRAKRYSLDNGHVISSSPRFANVPDGTYEFYHGKGWQVGWGGITSALPADSSLYSRTPANIQKLYNLGIEFDTAYAPLSSKQRFFPQRYAYFRDGDLYLLGVPVVKKNDPILIDFLAREQKRAQQSDANHPYVAFRDYGPPLKEDGQPDVEFIRTFGVTIPNKNYLVLGDNHAMSSDSRIFGFVPENNLQGAPSLIFWPPGDRLGPPMQKPYPIINLPRIIIWSIALVIAAIWYILHRRKLSRPIFKKKIDS